MVCDRPTPPGTGCQDGPWWPQNLVGTYPPCWDGCLLQTQDQWGKGALCPQNLQSRPLQTLAETQREGPGGTVDLEQIAHSRVCA